MDEQFLKKLFADFAKRGIKLAAEPLSGDYSDFGIVPGAGVKPPPGRAVGGLKSAPTSSSSGVKPLAAWSFGTRPGPTPTEFYYPPLPGLGMSFGRVLPGKTVPPGSQLHGPDMPDYKAGPGMHRHWFRGRSNREISYGSPVVTPAPPPPAPPPPRPGPVTGYLSRLFQNLFH